MNNQVYVYYVTENKAQFSPEKYCIKLSCVLHREFALLWPSCDTCFRWWVRDVGHMAQAGREINKGLLLFLLLADQWHAFPRSTARQYVV